MRGFNSAEVLRLLEKWPDVQWPIYEGQTEEELDSRWLAMALAGAHAQNPGAILLASGDWVTVTGAIKSIRFGNVIEFDGHQEVGIPAVRCAILERKELADANLASIVTAWGQIITVQRDSSGERVTNIAIARAKVLVLRQEQR